MEGAALRKMSAGQGRTQSRRPAVRLLASRRQQERSGLRDSGTFVLRSQHWSVAEVDRAEARRAFERLVERRDGVAYSNQTSESNIRANLMEPLLHDVLGWDTQNLHEYDRERYNRGVGIADAACLHEGRPVLYLEAKRLGKVPSLADLKRSRRFYGPGDEQAIRYARRSTTMQEGERWTLLANFDRLRLFEATTEERVLAFDSPAEMLERFDDLMLLSREQVLGGGLRREFALRKKPDVDEEFREVLNGWRLALAQDMYDNNEDLLSASGTVDLALLQSGVQRLLDRLIILQFAADVDALGDSDPLRELLELTEPSRDPRALVARPSIRDSLRQVFSRFDAFYNTTLFGPGHPAEALEVSDGGLRSVVESVTSQSFRRLDADILGATYETYLGHVLRLVNGRIILDLRPELRRQGAVYYTPRHVVEAIVQRTIVPLLAEAISVDQVDLIRVLDPACGSGSFLIRAFDAFADWYELENARRRERSEAGGNGQATLSDYAVESPIHNYGKRILERNIYGVDLDPEAAELATVNLIMQALRRGRAGLELGRLPLILGQNIKVGNSLVPGLRTAPAVVNAQLAANQALVGELRTARAAICDLPDSESERGQLEQEGQMATAARLALNDLLAHDVPDPVGRSAFYWQLEFPEVFDSSIPESDRGFSVVIGNPPWIGFFGANLDRPYLEAHYRTAIARFDIYVPFVEAALGLLKTGGVLGFITPSNYFLRDYGRSLRDALRDEATIREIVDWGDVQLFEGATNYSAILIASNEAPSAGHELSYLRKTYDTEQARLHRQSELPSVGWVFLTESEARLVEAVRAAAPTTLGAVCRLGRNESGLAEGVITGQNNVFLLQRVDAERRGLEKDLLRPCVKGEDVARWSLPHHVAKVLIYPYKNDAVVAEDELRTDCPNIYGWLEQWRLVPAGQGGLSGRAYIDATGQKWYELWNQRREALLSVPKLLTPEVNDKPEFALAGADVAFTNSVTSATPTAASGLCQEYLAGLLNSRLLAVYHARHSVPKANGFLVYTPAFLQGLPIAVPHMDRASERNTHDSIVGRVKRLVELADERRGLVIDFRYYVQDFSVGPGTLNSLMNRYRADARMSLCNEAGEVKRVSIRRDGPDVVTVAGAVRLSGETYDHGDYEHRDLLRLRVPEPGATFLERFVPTGSGRFAPAPRGRGRSLGARAGDLLLPTIKDTEMREILARYEPILGLDRRLATEQVRLEAEVDVLVEQIYGLDEQMRQALAEARLPSETIGAAENEAGAER